MGTNKLGSIMKRMAEKANLQGRKVNLTARKTSVETMCRAQFQDSEVMQFSGHRNVASLNSYWQQTRDLSLYSVNNIFTVQLWTCFIEMCRELQRDMRPYRAVCMVVACI